MEAAFRIFRLMNDDRLMSESNIWCHDNSIEGSINECRRFRHYNWYVPMLAGGCILESVPWHMNLLNRTTGAEAA